VAKVSTVLHVVGVIVAGGSTGDFAKYFAIVCFDLIFFSSCARKFKLFAMFNTYN